MNSTEKEVTKLVKVVGQGKDIATLSSKSFELPEFSEFEAHEIHDIVIRSDYFTYDAGSQRVWTLPNDVQGGTTTESEVFREELERELTNWVNDIQAFTVADVYKKLETLLRNLDTQVYTQEDIESDNALTWLFDTEAFILTESGLAERGETFDMVVNLLEKEME